MRYSSYTDIFEKRGNLYDEAMNRFENARDDEFENIVKLADIQNGEKIADIPAGGCYLDRYIKKSVEIVSIETTKQFYRSCLNKKRKNVVLVENVASLPFQQNEFDRVISLAGIHHLHDKEKREFYKEIHRVTKPQGIFALADVGSETKAGRFLNEFVDKYNPMGHKGIFLDEKTRMVLQEVGFDIAFFDLIDYYWKFDTEADMLEFIGKLFGLRNVNENILLEALQDYLGYTITKNGVLFHWSLLFVKAVK